ncbi:MAG: bifunctional DNA-formamidopyrimidine glycosylase/DNA-(apurinic or apyrimidinic site) lyase [Bryobacteraceae bacterium]
MPELPEVEAVASRIRQDAQGAQIASVEIQRPRVIAPQTPDHFRQLTEKARLTTVERRGKHLILRLSNVNAIHIHLRLSGNVRVVPDGRLLPAATRLTLHLRDGRAIILEDARALARASALPAAEIPKLFEDLGPEPLSPEFTPDLLAAEAARSRQPAKLFLMNQKHLAGLGNVYAAEALFRAGIHPLKPMNKLSKPRIAALHAAIVETLRDAVQSAMLAYSQPGEIGEAEWFPRAVYRRAGEPCPRCGRKVRRIEQGGRSTYYCPGCQK